MNPIVVVILDCPTARFLLWLGIVVFRDYYAPSLISASVLLFRAVYNLVAFFSAYLCDNEARAFMIASNLESKLSAILKSRFSPIL